MNILSYGVAAAAFILAVCTSAFAGPGAHGPGGEHLDSEAANAAGASARPRVEAKSELFELVGYLGDGEVSVMINRFETNEPVLNASLEVAMGSSKAVAKFHADHGDYAVDDAGFLKALSAPGKHALIFTVIAGSDSDLLEGTLTVKAPEAHDDATDHSHAINYALAGAGVLTLLVVAAALWRRRARKRQGYAGTEAL